MPWFTDTCVCVAVPEPWRQSLAKGDCVDGADSLHKWYNAKVLDSREPREAGGSKLLLITYDGWSSYYNEWLPANTFMYVLRSWSSTMLLF